MANALITFRFAILILQNSIWVKQRTDFIVPVLPKAHGCLSRPDAVGSDAMTFSRRKQKRGAEAPRVFNAAAGSRAMRDHARPRRQTLHGSDAPFQPPT